jgi:hypothetical protein
MMRSLGSLAIAALVAACSSASIKLEELDAAGLTARCERFVRCGLASSTGACEASFRKPPPSSFGPARDAGRLAFDGEQARSCEDALAAQSCDVTTRDVRVVPDACKKMFRGRIAAGDACAFDEECASSRCGQQVCPEGACCVGTCDAATAGGPGDACDRSSQCSDGFCDAADHTCRALIAANTTCMRDEECDFGLACLSPSPSLPGTCKPLPHVGEACPYQRCAELGAVCDATSHCVAVGLPGKPCTSNGDCSTFTECDAKSRVCIELPTLGMPCDVACAGDAYCKFDAQDAGTCAAPDPNGAVCDDAGTCASRNCKPGPVFPSCEDYPICP